MPVSLKKGQKVSLTKGNPGLKNVVVGIGWDINAYDTGGDFDLDAAAFCLTDSGRVSDSNDFVFYDTPSLARPPSVTLPKTKRSSCDFYGGFSALFAKRPRRKTLNRNNRIGTSS